jgi:hypothetical protein
MHPMPFPNILAFVEGAMEQLFINNNFHYVEVIPVSNGSGWSVDALSTQIVTFYLARDANADAFVIWLDRERRPESADAVCDAIRKALSAAGADVAKIHILVGDKMVENIILSDQDFIRSTFGDPTYVYEHEGKGGKHILKSMYKAIGENYRETKHGVAAMKAIRLQRCAQNSPSVLSFLRTFKFPCWWVSSGAC